MLKNLDAAIHKASVLSVLYTQRNQEMPHRVADIKADTTLIVENTNNTNSMLKTMMVEMKSIKIEIDQVVQVTADGMPPTSRDQAVVLEHATCAKRKLTLEIAEARLAVQRQKTEN